MPGTAVRTSIPDIERRLTDPSFWADPYPTYDVLRREAPVYWSETQGRWLVTAFDLAEQVLTRPADFSSVGFESRHIARLPQEVGAQAGRVAEHFATPQLVSSDPPDHTRIRRAFGSHFLPRKVASLGDLIRATAARLVNTADREQFDVVADLAEPLPVHVISDVVGIPHEFRNRIPPVTLDQREFFGSPDIVPDHAVRFTDSLEEWHGLLTGWMDERRVDPQDDVLTRAAQMVDEDRVTHDEAIATLLHLVIAGNGTTTALIGNALYHILRDPEQAKRIAEDRELIPNAIEETLRYETPLPSDRRIATRELSLGDAAIPEGDLVMAVLAAANRDPAHFPDPERFDITRRFQDRHHFAFGRGIHLCLGAPVARLEAAIAVEAVFDHFGDPGLVAGFEPDWHAITTHRGLRTLPVRASR